MNGVNREALNEKLLTEALARLGYRRVRRRVYRALWATPEVEHFLYFSTHGTPDEFVTSHFGLRNAAAEAFSIKAIKKYGGALYTVLKHNQEFDCAMRFSLGKLAEWGSRWSLFVPGMDESALFDKISFDVRGRLFPIIKGVTTLDHLVFLLLDDAEPGPWFVTNGAIRAAHIVSAARQIGVTRTQIKEMLRPRWKWIEESLRGGVEPDVYVHKVVEDFG